MKVRVETAGSSSKVGVSGQAPQQTVKVVGVAGVSDSPIPAYDQSNIALSTAISAYSLANSITLTSNDAPAFDRANSAYSLSQNVYTFANTIHITSQAAFSKANTVDQIYDF